MATSIDEALEIAKRISPNPNEEIMICGGASVYQQFLPLAQRLYLTYIHQTFDGDTFFPEVNMEEWKIFDLVTDDGNGNAGDNPLVKVRNEEEKQMGSKASGFDFGYTYDDYQTEPTWWEGHPIVAMDKDTKDTVKNIKQYDELSDHAFMQAKIKKQGLLKYCIYPMIPTIQKEAELNNYHLAENFPGNGYTYSDPYQNFSETYERNINELGWDQNVLYCEVP